MAIDTPARLAILGAGPIGLEAALYARFLGYDVDVTSENKARGGGTAMLWPIESPTALAKSRTLTSALKLEECWHELWPKTCCWLAPLRASVSATCAS